MMLDRLHAESCGDMSLSGTRTADEPTLLAWSMNSQRKRRAKAPCNRPMNMEFSGHDIGTWQPTSS